MRLKKHELNLVTSSDSPDIHLEYVSDDDTIQRFPLYRFLLGSDGISTEMIHRGRPSASVYIVRSSIRVTHFTHYDKSLQHNDHLRGWM